MSASHKVTLTHYEMRRILYSQQRVKEDAEAIIRERVLGDREAPRRLEAAEAIIEKLGRLESRESCCYESRRDCCATHPVEEANHE